MLGWPEFPNGQYYPALPYYCMVTSSAKSGQPKSGQSKSGQPKSGQSWKVYVPYGKIIASPTSLCLLNRPRSQGCQGGVGCHISPYCRQCWYRRVFKICACSLFCISSRSWGEDFEWVMGWHFLCLIIQQYLQTSKENWSFLRVIASSIIKGFFSKIDRCGNLTLFRHILPTLTEF
jgi:hypothetical protein